MNVFDAMTTRKSARAFLDTPVSRHDIEEIIKFAGMAPSAINMQPWEYLITYGEEKDRLVRKLLKIHKERMVPCTPGTTKPLPEKYSQRNRNMSTILKQQLTEIRTDMKQFVEEGSCSFYGAPIAIIVTIDRIFPRIRYLDIGLSVSYLMLAAHGKGLATCPIGLITAYEQEIADLMNISPEKKILLGIALGYADTSSPVNNVKTSREQLTAILTWYE
jgi:nitroreductase